MPGYSKPDNALATKLVTIYPDNSKKGLPSHHAQIYLFDPETGILQAVSESLIISHVVFVLTLPNI